MPAVDPAPAAKRKAALKDIAARRDPVAYAETKRKRMRDADITHAEGRPRRGKACKARLRFSSAWRRSKASLPGRQQQAVQSLLQRNQQRLSSHHKGADLVTVDGPDATAVDADLADEYQDSLAQWQEKRETTETEADLLDTEAEGNQKRTNQHNERRGGAESEQEAEQQRKPLGRPGASKRGANNPAARKSWATT